MAKLVIKILKVLLVLIIIGLLVYGTYLLVERMNWPLWMGGAILLIYIAIFAGILFIRKLIFRRREEGFIKQVIEQDDTLVAEIDKARRIESLQDRWKEAIKSLKRSQLKKLGPPLYVLPWYLMIGEPGSGKSTALRSSGLTPASLDMTQPSGTSATKNCDWWFFKEAIVLDTTGRYAIHSEDSGDMAEWRKFLFLLYRYRKKEPINGVVVSISADKLARSERAVIEEYGRNIRRSIDQLMRVLGSRFPVYVLVTKTDQILGMTEFSQMLPHDTVKQAMGYINHNTKVDSNVFLEDAMKNVSDRLKSLRLVLLNESENENLEAGLLVFPDEILKLSPGLEAFFHGAFQENPYNEPPMLRGIFFGSGHQEGTPYSHIFESLGFTEDQKEEIPTTKHGLFLYDFFSKVLPADRNLATPLIEFLKWRRLTRSLGLTAWIAFGVAFCALLTMSFMKNYSVIEAFEQSFLKPSSVQMEERTLDNIVQLDEIYKEIMELEGLNRYWWLPRLGLEQSSELEAELKDRFIKRFNSVLMDNLDQDMMSSIDGFDENTDDAILGEYIEYTSKRINMIKAYIAGNDEKKLKKMSQPFFAGISIIAGIEKEHAPIMKILNKLYISSLVWRKDRGPVTIKLAQLEAALIKMVELKGNNMKWLEGWANSKETLSPIVLNQFWDIVAFEELNSTVFVPPAFTVKGKQKIDDMIAELQDAMLAPDILEGRKKVFNEWYSNRYIYTWYNFASRFLEQEAKLRQKTGLASEEEAMSTMGYGLESRDDWQRLTNKMTTLSNPYFELLDRMAVELKHLKDSKNAPEWLSLVVNFNTMKNQAANASFLEEALTLARAAQGGEALIEGSQEKIGGIKDAKVSIDVHLKALKHFQEYQTALLDIYPILDSKDHAYNMASQLFKEISDESTDQTPFDTAYMSLESLKNLLGNPRKNEAVFWNTLEGPLKFLLYYTTIETACSLQSAWDNQILAEVQGTPDENMDEALFGESGAVWNFINGAAEPFLSRNEKGYYARIFRKEFIPFYATLETFLKRGTTRVNMLKSEYDVKFKVLPTEINDQAQEKPYVVILELQCSDGVQRLENYNFPVTKFFKWSKEKCGDVKLQIILKDIVLLKKYRGYTGFPEFLSDFRNGEHVFYPDDFPTQMIKLVELDIDEISVKYEIIGHEPLIRLIEVKPIEVPNKIVYCWK